jgi:hypothetical protein
MAYFAREDYGQNWAVLCRPVEVSVWRSWSSWLLVIIGVFLLAAGVARVLTTTSGAGAAVVVAAGALLLVVALILPHLEKVSVGTSDLDLQLTRDVAQVEAPEAARILERTELATFAEAYAFVHEDLQGDTYRAARIHLQDLLVNRAGVLANREKFKATEVRAMFANGSLAMRVLALGLMLGDPALADGATILAAIGEPRSTNEQYQALRLALLRWPKLPRHDKTAIRALLKSDEPLPPGTGRRELADEILAQPAR